MLIIPIRESNVQLIKAVNGGVGGMDLNPIGRRNRTYLVMEQYKKNKVISHDEFVALKVEMTYVWRTNNALYFAG